MPTCDPMSSAAPASDRLRTTQHIDISRNLIKPVSRTRRRLVFRASAKSMTVIWGAPDRSRSRPVYVSGLTPLLTAGPSKEMLPKNLQTISGGAPKFPKRISGNPRRETLEYPTFFQDLGCLKFGCIRTMRGEGGGSLAAGGVSAQLASPLAPFLSGPIGLNWPRGP